MAAIKIESILANHYYVTLILRLSLDQEGQLNQCELLDTTGSLSKRFTGRVGMHQVLDDWLNQLSHSYTTRNQPEEEAPANGNAQGNLD